MTEEMKKTSDEQITAASDRFKGISSDVKSDLSAAESDLSTAKSDPSAAVSDPSAAESGFSAASEKDTKSGRTAGSEAAEELKHLVEKLKKAVKDKIRKPARSSNPKKRRPLGDGIRLDGKWKHGIKSLLFSRFMQIIVLLGIQTVVIVQLINLLFGMIGPAAYYAERGIMVIGLIYLWNIEMDSRAKLTWMVIISLIPLFGILFLLWTRLEVGHRTISKRLVKTTELFRKCLHQDPDTFEDLKRTDPESSQIAAFTMLTGDAPAYEDTKVTYFPVGEDAFAEMIPALEEAKKFIFLEYFIIEEGHMWGNILEVLAEKVKEGVEVRVLFDGTNLLSKVPEDYADRLEKLGIVCRVWEPLKPIVSTTYNYRDHRKILVIDGEIAFNGGINLADEYINRTHPLGHWKDTALMIEGEAVPSYTMMFLSMWNAQEKTFETDYLKYFPEQIPIPDDANGFVIPYGSSPLDDRRVAEMIYVHMLQTAKHYCYIMTPYLILDDTLEAALKFAAERGVDVRLILPGIPDKKLVYALTKASAKPLIKSGVKVYLYKPGFIHAKQFVSDDRKAIVGTINLDYRSLYHHFECATFMLDTDCVAQIKQDFLDIQEKCTQATIETLKKENIIMRIIGAVVKMISPML